MTTRSSGQRLRDKGSARVLTFVCVAMFGCRATVGPFTPLQLGRKSATAETRNDLILSARVVRADAGRTCRALPGCLDLLLVFSEQIAAETVDADDVLLLFDDGRRASALDIRFAPADERDENRSLWATFPRGDRPVAVEIIGAMYDETGRSQLGAGAVVDNGQESPTVLTSETQVAGAVCAGANWAVRLYWSDRVALVRAGGHAEVTVLLADGRRVLPVGVDDAEQADPDNVFDLCVAEADEPRALQIPGDSFVDDRGRSIEALDIVLPAVSRALSVDNELADG